MKYDTGTIKRLVSCRDLLALNGIETNRKNKARCCFHNDTHASMQVYPDGIHCYSCGAHTDVIGLAQQLYGVGFGAAKEILAEQFGIAPSTSGEDWKRRADEQRRKRQEQADRIERLRDAYFDAVRQYRDAEAERDLLAPRRMDEIPGALFFAALDRVNEAADNMMYAEWALHDAEDAAKF